MDQSDEDIFQPVMNPLPPVVAVLCLAMFGIELVFWAGSRGLVGGPLAVGWRLDALQSYAMLQPLLAWMAETGRWFSPEALRFLTFPFVHHGFGHMLMAVVFLLALGKLIGDTFGNMAVAVVFFGSSIVGALVWAVFADGGFPLAGGYPAAYGLIGAFTFMLWANLGAEGRNRLAAFRLIGVLIALRLVFGLMFGVSDVWIAEGAGFVFGFVVAPLLAPGGLIRLRDRLRQR